MLSMNLGPLRHMFHTIRDMPNIHHPDLENYAVDTDSHMYCEMKIEWKHEQINIIILHKKNITKCFSSEQHDFTA